MVQQKLTEVSITFVFLQAHCFEIPQFINKTSILFYVSFGAKMTTARFLNDRILTCIWQQIDERLYYVQSNHQLLIYYRVVLLFGTSLSSLHS